jgi:alcohol dehydrogenase (NADP+)
MTRLVENGKARHIGVCNFSPKQLHDLLNHTSYPPAVHQMEYVLGNGQIGSDDG